ncbi:MAG: hypothetical protein WD939_02180 [Dehalococcoidia bacterium]
MLTSKTAAGLIPRRMAGRVPTLPLAGALGGYLLATIAAAAWLPMPEAARAALALPALAVIPLLVGSAAMRLVPVLNHVPALDGFGRALVGWLLGSLVLAALAVVLHLAGLALLLRQLGLIALALALASLVALRAKGGRPTSFGAVGPLALALTPVVLLSIAPKAIAARYAEFPQLTGNVVGALHFTQPALRLIEQGYFDLDNPSHGPALVSLLAIVSQLYGAEPISLLWMGPFLLFAAFGVGLFLWANAVTGSPTTAVLVAAIGAFLPVEPLFYSATPIVVRSNTILFALLPLGLYLVHQLVTAEDARPRAKAEALIALQGCVAVLFVAMNAYRLGVFGQDARVLLMLGAAAVLAFGLATANKRRWGWSGLPALFAVVVGFQVFHVFEGPMFLTALIVYGLALTARGLRADRAFALGLCAAVGAFFLVQYTGILTFPEDFSLSSSVFGSTYETFSANFVWQVDLLTLTLSPVVLVLMLLGIGGFLVRKREAYGRAAVMAAAVMFACYFLPDPFAYRLNKSFTPFIALLVVAGALNTGTVVSRLVRRRGDDSTAFRHVAQLAMVAVALPSFVVPFLQSASYSPRVTVFPEVSSVEYELGDWVQEQTGEHARIVSDSQTMLLLTSLGNGVAIAERTFLLEEMSPAGREQMTFLKEAVLGAPSGCAAYASLASLAGTEPARERRFIEATGVGSGAPEFFVVWTPKTFLWTTRAERIDPILSPVGVDTMPWWQEGMAPFRDRRFFREVAQIADEAFVFAALPAADVPQALLTSCASQGQTQASIESAAERS